jgi:hypothetical protein
MKTIHDRVVSAGCTVLFFGFFGAIVWTIIGGWKQSVWIGVTLGGGLLLIKYSSFRRRRAVQRFIHSAFTPRGVEAPTFKWSDRYGYPGYELFFTSKAAEEAAMSSGALADFKASIQDFHRHDGREYRPFDVEYAVRTDYPHKPVF